MRIGRYNIDTLDIGSGFWYTYITDDSLKSLKNGKGRDWKTINYSSRYKNKIIKYLRKGISKGLEFDNILTQINLMINPDFVNFDRNIIFEYLDKTGIPFKRIAGVEIDFEKSTNYLEDVNSPFYTDNESQFLSFSTVFIELPYKLSQDEQHDVVFDWIKFRTGFDVKDVNVLPQAQVYDGKPFLIESHSLGTLKFLNFSNLTMPYSFVIRDKRIKTLGRIELINGSLGLDEIKIENLGDLEQIMGDLWFSGSDEFKRRCFKLRTLSPLKRVGGNVSIRGRSVSTLGTLDYVGGNLSLRFSGVKNLGNLKYVGGNLLISKYNIPDYDFSKVEVRGKIKRYNDSINKI